MALRTRVTIWDTDGYEADRIADDYTTVSYSNHFSHSYTLSGSTTKVKVELGPVTTAAYIYMNSVDQEVTVYKNNSAEGWTFTGPFLVRGCEVTALHVLAESATTLFIYIAGT